MSNNSAHQESVVVEQSTATTVPIHEVTDVPASMQATPLGRF